MKIKLKDNSILDVIRIVGENMFSTTFEKTDRNDITINNKEIVKIVKNRETGIAKMMKVKHINNLFKSI